MSLHDPNPALHAGQASDFLTRCLTEHDTFLRALARGLLGDADRAEDAVQDAYASALTHPPRIDSAPGSDGHRSATRSWLATVVQNHARNRLRGDARRSERERRVARAESQQDDVAERLRVQRRVMSAVESLREPYRTAVFLRFAEGLPPREIALRTDAPVETVRSRVQRGLEMLRSDLDRDFGDRASWCAALLPFVPFVSPRASLSTTTVPISAWLALVVAALVIPLSVWFATTARDDLLATAPAITPIGASWSAATGQESSVESIISGTRRAVVAVAKDSVVLPLTIAGASAASRVRVVDERGTPLLGIRAARSNPSADDGWIDLAQADDVARVFDAASGAELRVLARTEFDDGTLDMVVDVPATFVLDADPADIEDAEFELAGIDGVVVARSRAHIVTRSFVRFDRVPQRTLLERGGGAEWTLSAVSPDGARHASARVHAVRGSSDEPIALVFAPAARAELRVASATGVELADVRVETNARVAASTEPGVFGLTATTAGPIDAVVRGRGHVSRRFSIPTTSDEPTVVDVALDPRAGHEFAVEFHSASGRADADFVFELQSDLDPLESRSLHIEASPGGRALARFEEVAPGEYTLRPRDASAWPFEPRELRIQIPGSTPRFVRRDERPSAAVFVRARDSAGRVVTHARCAVLVDRYELGKRAASAAQGIIPACDVHSDDSTKLVVAEGRRFWWLVEADGFTSVQGDERSARIRAGRVEIDVRLEPSWRCELWIAGRSASGTIAALADVRVTTQAGRELATSLADGRIVLDLPYDPGQLRIESLGRRVAAWEGFANGRRRAELPVHRVLLESER